MKCSKNAKRRTMLSKISGKQVDYVDILSYLTTRIPPRFEIASPQRIIAERILHFLFDQMTTVFENGPNSLIFQSELRLFLLPGVPTRFGDFGHEFSRISSKCHETRKIREKLVGSSCTYYFDCQACSKIRKIQ